MLVTALHIAGWQIYWTGEHTVRLDVFFSQLAAVLLGWQLARNGWLRSSHWSSIGMQAAQAAGLAACAQLLAFAQVPEPLPHTPPGTLVECQTVYTDAGTPIKLYERQVAADDLRQFYSVTESHVASLSKFAMLRDKAVPQLNCHGWVFSGQHVVKGSDVPLILEENGYREVSQPQVTDLVIYFDPAASVVHTGIVCGHIRDSVLIESKWGLTATYVHLADEQPYSPEYRFYRSPRSGHRLQPYNPVERLAQSAHRNPTR